jgi:3-oxoacyl-(acyl-carrier-protein) synthase
MSTTPIPAAMIIQRRFGVAAFQANPEHKLNQCFLLVPTANCEHLDADCDLDIVKGRARRTKVNRILPNARGLGGGSCSLVLERVRE